MTDTNLIRLFVTSGGSLSFEVSPWIVLVAVVLPFAAAAARRWYPVWLWPRRRRHFRVVTLDIALGGIGKVSMRPVVEDVQIAHRIWTELATRKAALPIQEDDDVIVEVYSSWYTLFGKVRELIASIPADLVRSEPSTQELVRIATDTLNKGLRPHLTRWQAKFRNWYASQEAALKNKTPQEVQRSYADYEALMSDLKKVNRELIGYAAELQKLVHAA